ncbi:MAG: DUF2723 domain-containing protein [bacterium]
MNYKYLNRTFGGLVFLLAAITYLLTVQPTVPFWDCGEFANASIWQQVPHPPGAPLFLMVGKLFHLLIPFGDPGWRVNLVSVFATAFSVLFLYLIIVKALENFRGKAKDFTEAISIYGAAFIGAAALIYCDTIWFNAVESEVYAASLFFHALLTYLIMLWNEKADEPHNEKYLLLIIYIIGLSTGVHLLAIFAIFPLFLIVYFRKYEFKWKSFIVMGILAIITFFIIYPFTIKYIPAFLAGHSANRNTFGEYDTVNSMFLKVIALGTIIAALVAFIIGVRKKKAMLALIGLSYVFIILGFTTYTQILIRSHANSPMNENEPKNFNKLAQYLGREQYGSAPTFTRRYQLEERFIQTYLKKDAKGDYEYGEWYWPDYDNTTGEMTWPKENAKGDWAYTVKYQMNHMYWRYFGWNFIGRVSDVQDAGVAGFGTPPEDQIFNHDSGYKDQFPIRFFALPFLLGLIGLIFHFYKDPKYALAFFALFLLAGVLSALQQNQQDPQPRERDYFYAGSFFIWCMWIGMGVKAIIEISTAKKKSKFAVLGLLVLGFIAAPLNMAMGGWKIHSRAGNYLPFDYSYNILQSTEKDAILFTNGDNDTFPVWYIQDVMGVRRDVRVVNLSLGQTAWYIEQLKNREPWGAKKIPLSFSDELLSYDESDPRSLQPLRDSMATMISIPVRRDILAKFTSDTALLNRGAMSFLWVGVPKDPQQPTGKQNFYTNNQLVLDIMKVTKFERPVYFSTTVGPDVFSGLERFMRLEGMAWRICPTAQATNYSEEINSDIMYKCLMNVDNSNNYHKEPHYGFKFRNLNNMNVYYDEVHRRLMDSYRHLFYVYSEYAQRKMKNNAISLKVMNQMNKLISVKQFPISYDMAYRFGNLYNIIGAQKERDMMLAIGIENCKFVIAHPEVDPEVIQKEITGNNLGVYRMAAWMYQMKKDYTNAQEMLLTLKAQYEAYKNSIAGSVDPNSQAGSQAMQGIQSSLLGVGIEIDELKIQQTIKVSGAKAGMDTAKAILARCYAKGTYYDQMYAQYLTQKVMKIRQELGLDTSFSVANKSTPQIMQ